VDEDFLRSVRELVERESPDSLRMLGIYEAEARFARQLFAGELRPLPRGAPVLEVGAGCFLLSAQLSLEGFSVTALEPTGSGFSHLAAIGAHVCRVLHDRGIALQVLAEPVETLDVPIRFSLALSINVMEHVADPYAAVPRVAAALSEGATFRFVCPNYAFPYEPHFGIPALPSKALTEKVFRRSISSRDDIADPDGTWSSLNWITQRRARSIVRRTRNVRAMFTTDATVAYLQRSAGDESFRDRKSGLVRLASAFTGPRLQRIIGFVPRALLPVIDCRVQRVATADRGGRGSGSRVVRGFTARKTRRSSTK
jgi:SAM-dependent methyltransferase